MSEAMKWLGAYATPWQQVAYEQAVAARGEGVAREALTISRTAGLTYGDAVRALVYAAESFAGAQAARDWRWMARGPGVRTAFRAKTRRRNRRRGR